MDRDLSQPLYKRGIFRILAVVLVVVAGAVVSIYRLGKKESKTPSSTTTNASSPLGNTAPSINFDTRRGQGREDTDGDGLPNTEEEAIGTNPTAADTDRDDLSDFDEVKVYRTDPKKPDSDGDGHTDGTEVRQRFNPAGSGKLFETLPPPGTVTQ